jgi:hypothetical protein
MYSGMTRMIRLPDENPYLFAIFLAWLTTGNIENAEELLTVTDTTKEQQNEHLVKQHTFSSPDVMSWQIFLAQNHTGTA